MGLDNPPTEETAAVSPTDADPARLLARLSRLESLLLAHKEGLESRLEELRVQLAQTGLETP